MSTAVFPGSFDPVTKGHMDLIYRASKMFDALVLGVLINSSKQPLLTLEERVKLLSEVTNKMPNVRVEAFEGLLVDFVNKCDADAIVRGLRSAGDFEYELPLAQANYKLNGRADTIFLATSPQYSYVSSSAVKELMRYNADISDFVPMEALKYLNRDK
ncbi:MAG: pantetheine-phosphate adenylyltransferase [Clostridium sp.]|uniref:pantetheine-phosphate adenylyltransferase n=1 Tax=Butyribacter sp. TaxID=2822465 RepID=UPI002A92E3DA|nr:pantetheine-phosphate adenylyltransferase [Clostridium sp.]MDY5181324.1 pantetheine-phosphate adenylyltransferase [Butyribacter sp.]